MTLRSWPTRHPAIERQYVLNDIPKNMHGLPNTAMFVHNELICFPQHPIKSTILSALIAEHSDILENITRLSKTTPKTMVSYSECFKCLMVVTTPSPRLVFAHENGEQLGNQIKMFYQPKTPTLNAS